MVRTPMGSGTKSGFLFRSGNKRRFRSASESGINVAYYFEFCRAAKKAGFSRATAPLGRGFGVTLPMLYEPLGYVIIRPIEHFRAPLSKGNEVGLGLAARGVSS